MHLLYVIVVVTALLLLIVVFNNCAVHCFHFDDYDSSEDDSSHDCTTIWGSDGVCTSLRECPPERWSGSRRDVCFHGRFSKFVCCHEVYQRPPRSDQKDRARERLNGVHGYRKKDKRGKRISEQKFEEYMDIAFMNTTEQLNTTEQIQGRVPTSPGKYPHMSALGWILESKQIDWKCGGNLISEYFVLTAAHCVSVNGQIPDIIRIGDLNLVETEETVFPQTFRVRNTFMHPDYDQLSYYFDIGLIELNKRAIFTEFVHPVCLWSKIEVPHENMVAMGYGSVEFGGVQTKTLTELSLRIMNNNECNKTLPSIPAASRGVVTSQICAIDPSGKTDTCQGDSGGPLQMNIIKNGRPYYYLVGITSFGIFCGGQYPSVYTRISSYVEWIENIVWPA